MGTARSFAVLAFAVFVGALTGAMIGSGTVADAQTETAASAVATVPRGAVVAFDRTTCPAGWHAFAKAQGRTVVGLNPGGTLRARIGTKLADQEVRKHKHVVDPSAQSTDPAGPHSHTWATYENGKFSSGGAAGADFVTWSNGMDAVGTGFYPLALDFKGSPGGFSIFSTGASGNHAHNLELDPTTSTAKGNRFPYIQLLMCEKD